MVVLGVGQVLARFLMRRAMSLRIERPPPPPIRRAACSPWQDVGEAADDHVALVYGGGSDDARLHGGHHRGVVGYDRHLAFRARNDDGPTCSETSRRSGDTSSNWLIYWRLGSRHRQPVKSVTVPARIVLRTPASFLFPDCRLPICRVPTLPLPQPASAPSTAPSMLPTM